MPRRQADLTRLITTRDDDLDPGDALDTAGEVLQLQRRLPIRGGGDDFRGQGTVYRYLVKSACDVLDRNVLGEEELAEGRGGALGCPDIDVDGIVGQFRDQGYFGVFLLQWYYVCGDSNFGNYPVDVP